MSLKIKLISCVSAFCLILAMLIVGVFAVRNTSLTVGGSIQFTANGIDAEISSGTMSGGEWNQEMGVDGAGKMQGFVINTKKTESEITNSTEYKSWSGLHLLFNKNGEEVTITFYIKNNHKTEVLAVNIITSGEGENVSISVVGDKSGLIGVGETENYTITFRLDNPDIDGNLDDFEIKFMLSKPDVKDISYYQDKLTFHSRTETTYSVQAKDAGISGDVDIPGFVKEEGKVYKVNRIEKVGDETGAFKGTNITSVTIPETINYIEAEAFTDCVNITTMNWNAIAVEDFSYSDNILQNVGNSSSGVKFVIGPNVTKLPEYLFTDNPNSSTPWCNLNSIDYLGTLESWCKIDVGIGRYSSPTRFTGKLIIGGEEVTQLHIPEGVKKICDYAFYNCSNITEVTLPSSLTYIGQYAFAGCNITEITIPENVKYMGSSSFLGCKKLKNVYYNAIDAEGDNCFANAGGEDGLELVIGDMVRRVTGQFGVYHNNVYLNKVTINSNNLVFDTVDSPYNHGGFNDCPSLTEITINSSNPPEVKVSSLGIPAVEHIYIPSGSLAKYQQANGWKEYVDKLVEVEF